MKVPYMTKKTCFLKSTACKSAAQYNVKMTLTKYHADCSCHFSCHFAIQKELNVVRFLILHKHYLSKQDTMLFSSSKPKKYVRLFLLVFRVVFSGAASRFVGFVIIKGLLTTCIMSVRSEQIFFISMCFVWVRYVYSRDLPRLASLSLSLPLTAVSIRLGAC